MTLTINLSPQEEARLREKAARWGQDESDYAASVLRQDIYTLPIEDEPADGQTLAEALAGRIGLFSSAEPSNAAQDSEAEFGKIMDEKRRTEHI